MNRFQAIGTVISGLGFFFIGFRLLNTSMRTIYSRRLRLSLAALTKNRITASILGALSGLLIQSAPFFTFIQAGATAAGIVDVRKILPVIFWVNVGCSLLVGLSTIDVSSWVLYFFGFSAIAWAFIKNRTWKTRLEALIAISLIYYGLHLIKAGATQAVSDQYITTIIMSSGESLVLSFIIGIVLAALAQSSIFVTMIAISAAHASLFSLNQLILFVYGTMIGVSLLIWILSWKLRGHAKQVAISQVLFDAGGVAFMLALFLVEYGFDIPLVVALVKKIGGSFPRQIAALYILFNVATACILTLSVNRFHSLVALLYPPTKEEVDTQLVYLHTATHLDAATGMDILKKELFHNISIMQNYFTCAEAAIQGNSVDSLKKVRSPFRKISTEIDAVLDDLSKRPLIPYESEMLINLLRMQELSKNLESELAMMTQGIVESQSKPELAGLTRLIFEASDAIWATFLETIHSKVDDDIDILIAMTSDKGDVLANFRSVYAEKVTTFEQRKDLTDLTVHFERWVWLLNRFAHFLKQEENAREKREIG